jgi:hypothetical protein
LVLAGLVLGGAEDGLVSAVIKMFPNWKTGDSVTAEDRLMELASIARDRPDRFKMFVMIYQEDMPNGNLKTGQICFGADLPSALGLLELGKQAIFEESQTK